MKSGMLAKAIDIKYPRKTVVPPLVSASTEMQSEVTIENVHVIAPAAIPRETIP